MAAGFAGQVSANCQKGHVEAFGQVRSHQGGNETGLGTGRIEPSEEFQLIKTVSNNSFKSQSGSSEKYARGLAELTAEETRRIGIKAYVEREGNQYHVLFHVMAATSEPDKLREFPADTMTLDETCSFLRNLGIAPKVIFPAM